MTYYGRRPSIAFDSWLRYMRAADGALLELRYRVRTMLDEDGNVVCVGEADIHKRDGEIWRQRAQVVVSRERFLTAAPGVVGENLMRRELDELDQLVPQATPFLMS